MNKKIIGYILSGFACLCFLSSFNNRQKVGTPTPNTHPKIVNIVNFSHLPEPCYITITTQVLYETVVKQVNRMQQYKRGFTFLMQYDALLDGRYQQLLKPLPQKKLAGIELCTNKRTKVGTVNEQRYFKSISQATN